MWVSFTIGQQLSDASTNWNYWWESRKGSLRKHSNESVPRPPHQSSVICPTFKRQSTYYFLSNPVAQHHLSPYLSLLILHTGNWLMRTNILILLTLGRTNDLTSALGKSWITKRLANLSILLNSLFVISKQARTGPLRVRVNHPGRRGLEKIMNFIKWNFILGPLLFRSNS